MKKSVGAYLSLRFMRQFMVSAAVVIAMRAMASAVTPAEDCQDTVAHEGRKLMERLFKRSSKCEAARAKGKIGPAINCQTSLVDIVPPEYTAPGFNDAVYAARAALTEEVQPACAGVVPDAGIGTPCGANEGIFSVEDLAACIVYDGHGRWSARIQNILFRPQPQPMLDAPTRNCLAAIVKSVGKWTKRRLINARICGKAAALGRACDVVALNAKLTALADKLRAKTLARCPAGLPLLVFGGNCYDQFVNWADAYACLMDAVRSEADAAASMAYPGTGF